MDDGARDDTRAVLNALADLARTLHNTTGPRPELTPDRILEEVTTCAVEVIECVDHACITLIRPARHGRRAGIASVACTGEVASTLDAVQGALDDGPCLASAREHATVVVTDYRTEDRWPDFSRAVLDRTSVRSSVSIQLFTDKESFGALNLYSDTVAGFDDNTVDQALALAAHAAVAFSGARRSEQFLSALLSRDIIGQAKGMLMERYGVDARRAFAMLSTLSQNANVPLIELARSVVEGEHPATKPVSRSPKR